MCFPGAQGPYSRFQDVSRGCEFGLADPKRNDVLHHCSYIKKLADARRLQSGYTLCEITRLRNFLHLFLLNGLNLPSVVRFAIGQLENKQAAGAHPETALPRGD